MTPARGSGGLNVHRIFQELQSQGYPGDHKMIKLGVRRLRAERDRRQEATMRFETPPGHQAQKYHGEMADYLTGPKRFSQCAVANSKAKRKTCPMRAAAITTLRSTSAFVP
jgi:hypothetical protein